MTTRTKEFGCQKRPLPKRDGRAKFDADLSSNTICNEKLVMPSLLVVALLALAPPARAQAQWKFVAFAGAGFSGRNVERAVANPAFNGTSFVPDSVDLTKDASFDWRPTISSGLELRS